MGGEPRLRRAAVLGCYIGSGEQARLAPLGLASDSRAIVKNALASKIKHGEPTLTAVANFTSDASPIARSASSVSLTTVHERM
jgi:hypothetical protein